MKSKSTFFTIIAVLTLSFTLSNTSPAHATIEEDILDFIVTELEIQIMVKNVDLDFMIASPVILCNLILHILIKPCKR